MRAGIRVFALDGDPKAAGLTLADKAGLVDVRDPEAVVAAVRDSGIVPDGAISFVSEVGMASAARLREYFHLPGPKSDLTEVLSNKARQRAQWQKTGVPGPQWKLVRTADEIREALQEIGFPAVIKPVDSAGSRGVTKLEDEQDWLSAAERALASSHSKTALVESYLAGTEHTIETFGHKGQVHVLAVTEKKKVPGTGGTVANELATPSSKRNSEIVAKTAVSALMALGYTEGAGHTEIILSPKGEAGLVETGGRGGGFMVFDGLVPLASGFDIATACALQAVGLPVPAITNLQRAVVLRFFPSRPGIVQEILGFETASHLPGVQAEAFVSVGEHTGNVKGDGDRLGYILAQAENPGAAQSLADRAESLIHFRIEDYAETAHH